MLNFRVPVARLIISPVIVGPAPGAIEASNNQQHLSHGRHEHLQQQTLPDIVQW
jgi:hypothetical protein